MIKHPYTCTYKPIRNIISSLAKGENLPFLKIEDCHPRLYTGTYISFIKDFHKRGFTLRMTLTLSTGRVGQLCRGQWLCQELGH